MDHELKIIRNLIDHSVTTNINNVRSEWFFVSIIEASNNCNLCGHKMKHDVIIRNRINNNTLAIGTECAYYILNNKDQFKLTDELNLFKKKMSRRNKEIKKAEEFDKMGLKGRSIILNGGKITEISNVEFVKLQISQGKL